LPHPPSSSLFPYTTLFRSVLEQRLGVVGDEARRAPVGVLGFPEVRPRFGQLARRALGAAERVDQARHRAVLVEQREGIRLGLAGDRKSTRLNSSHQISSYA